MEILDNRSFKVVKSKNYNSFFDKSTGFFARWGKTKEEDPRFCEFGPEILDIEISSSNVEDIHKASDRVIYTDKGCTGIFCKNFCYKKNCGDKSVHMTLDTFKKILDNIPKTLGQIALGILGIDSHPQMWDIIDEGRKRGIAMNLTSNGVGITNEIAKKLSEKCGAVAISVNKYNKEIAYDTVKKLSQDFGMRQINFHIVLASETENFIREVATDIKIDRRLSNLNALVMLAFKDKQKTNFFHQFSIEKYNQLVNYLMEGGINIGFDSCSAHLFENYAQDNQQLLQCCEPCESGLFSFYINCFGYGYACSFYEGVGEWEQGIDLVETKDWWNNIQIKHWRTKLLSINRNCPLYQIGES